MFLNKGALHQRNCNPRTHSFKDRKMKKNDIADKLESNYLVQRCIMTRSRTGLHTGMVGQDIVSH